jgi:ferrous-iron efflux pump FieF
MRRATYASVAVATTLIVSKLIAWLLTDSVALLSTLIDSVLDAAASVVTLVAVHHAVQPADREHRFGHGKAESLAGLGQAAFVAGSGCFLLVEAVRRLVQPVPVSNELVGILVMALAIALTLFLVGFQRYVIRRTGSVAIGADALHYTGDLLINGSVALSLGIYWIWGWSYADPIFALAIVGYLMWNAVRIGRGALDVLMDRELPEEERDRIKAIVEALPDTRAMHDLRSRRSGTDTFIQFHLELDPHISLLRAHEIADEVEADIVRVFPAAEVIIHQDPQGYEERHPVIAAN